jgi:uncharacterized protein YbbC (DUF1343 family)
LTGLDVLALDDFALFRNKRIGLVTNHTGVTKEGTFITKYLKDAGIELTALFSPEHGFTGEFDKSNVEDSKDANTGLTVYSLYGETRKPSPEMLDNVDILVYDIQDVGVRFYTYTSTMSLAMEAAADKGIPFVVLDRPNPIRGDRVNGPILQAGRETFIAIHKMPVQHGLTIGEIALMIAAERRYDPILQVVPCLGWKREMDYDATKLKWINPSPNMRNLTEAYFYPGLGLLEFTNISVGRGTETPFEHFGAPWIFQGNVVADGRQEAGGFISDISPNLESPPSSSGLLANGTKDSFETKDFLKTKDSLEVFVAALNQSANQANLRGVRFEPATFTPTTREFQGEKCGGAKMILEDRESFQSVRLGLVIALTLYELYPDAWKTRNLNTLLLHDQTRQLLRNRAAAAEIEKSWQPELQEFLKRRENYLLY